MYKTTITHTNFSYGEISPNLFGRGDITAYKSSAMMIRNMTVLPIGGIERREGLKYIDTLSGMGKLISFEYSADELFILFISDDYIYIYNKYNILMTKIDSPYTLEEIKNVRWSQKGNELYLVHPDVYPKILKYDSVKMIWKLINWEFEIVNEYNSSSQPFSVFEDNIGISLTPSALTGDITLTASKELFDDTYLGMKFHLCGGEVKVNSITSSNVAEVTVRATLSDILPDYNWKEQVFSYKRGFPKSVAFHQNRLIIGGSKSLPNRIWFSKVGNYLNFDFGEGLDDEAIEFDIFSDRVNEILTVFSGKHLQIFTSDSEWIVTGSPLTPTSLCLKQQTKIGSVADRFIMPKLVEGSTIFVAKNKKEIREFFSGEIADSYTSDDLILLSNHLMNNPVEQDYNIKKRTLYVVQGDGSLSVLLTNKLNSLNAWFRYDTLGKFISICVVLDKVYVVVQRDDKYFLECFSEEVQTDCSKSFSYENGVETVSNLSHLEGKTVVVNADGFAFDTKVENATISLPVSAKNIFVGLPYTHILAPLPVLIGGFVPPKAVKLFDLSFRVADTTLLQVDTGQGLRNITCLDFDASKILDSRLPTWSGDIHVKSKGFIRSFEVPVWKIQGAMPYNIRILNISYIIGSVK